MLYLGGKVRADKNGGVGGGINCGGGGVRDIADQRNNPTRFMMHGNLKEGGAEMAAEKAVSTRGVGIM